VNSQIQIALQLFAFLVLAFLGIVAPIIIILLSMFSQGISKLKEQYENEKTQSEDNIRAQANKEGSAKQIDVKAIQESINHLKLIRKRADNKLKYLRPDRQILRLIMPLLISFSCIIIALFSFNNRFLFITISTSIIFFSYSIYTLWKLLMILMELYKTMDEEKKGGEQKTVELLNILISKISNDNSYFLKNVYIVINDVDIKGNNEQISFKSDEKTNLRIGIRNSEARMAKNIEIGMILTPDFLIEKNTGYSVFTDKDEQIIRNEKDIIHGNTLLRLKPLTVTALKKGNYKIKSFIKAENIESTYRIFQVTVT
jgi:hypothetical protein